MNHQLTKKIFNRKINLNLYRYKDAYDVTGNLFGHLNFFIKPYAITPKNIKCVKKIIKWSIKPRYTSEIPPIR